ncbi:MAG: ABC transporter ATP-binding protein [Patescibacteria group bacterium]
MQIPKFNTTRLHLITKYLALYKREVSLLIALSLLAAFFGALTPYIGGKIIDSLIKPISTVRGYILPVAPVFFFFGLWLTMQILINIVESMLGYRNRMLDEKIFADYIVMGTSHVINLPMSFHKAKKVGEIQNRLQTAAQNLSTIVTNVMVTLLPQFLSIAIALVVTLLVKPILTLFLLISVSIYVVIIFKSGPHYSKLLRKMWKAYNQAFGDAYDAAMNAHSVKQAGAEQYERRRLYKSFHLKALRYMKEMTFVWQIMNSAQRVLATLTQGTIYLVSIYFINQGSMTVGELVMFNGYVALFLGPFVILMNNWHVVQNGLVTLERAEKILREIPEEYDNENSTLLPDITGAVEFRDVNFTYGRKQKVVLQNISFQTRPGDVIALVGESGVGKSTMMDLVSRYFIASKGKVLVDNHDVKNLNLRFLRSKIAVVPQEILLFNDTIKNNIKYGSFNASDEQIEEAARLAYADQFITEFPKGYKQIVGERGVKLSVGQKQRIAIARAILRNPRILILDEPTSALDAKSEKLVEDALRTLMKGRTTFIIAHRLSTVRHANKILALEKGKIVEQGTHDELMKIQDGAYRKLYELQIGLTG